MNPDQKITAVVVTFNRKELLLECINAILEQSYRVDKILIIDNASTDGSEKYLKEYGVLNRGNIEYRTLAQNVGGAGGFYEGIKQAYEQGSDWLWIMDDDTIPTISALESLINAVASLNKDNIYPLLLSSRINWTDGDPHPMNFPQIKRKEWKENYLAIRHRLIRLRSTSFVSVLINRKSVEKYGLPIKEYFIWNDDVEYTGRILKENEGYLVPDSIVIHKTKTKYSAISNSSDRFYFEIRNKLWMILKSDAWSRYERLRFLAILLNNIKNFIKENRFSFKSLKITIKGVLVGILNSPMRKR